MKSLKDGFRLHVTSIKSGVAPTIFTSNQLVQLYPKHNLLGDARKIFDEMPDRNVFTWNSIIAAYVKNHNLEQAQALFNSAPCKDIVTYSTMLSAYVCADGQEQQAVRLFSEMQFVRAQIGFDEFGFTAMLNLTSKLSDLSCGRQVHALMVKTGCDSNRFSVSSLIDMYSKCGCFSAASQMFNRCSGVIDLVSKNAMIAACFRQGEIGIASDLFHLEAEWNDTASWNTMLCGYVHNGYQEEALKFFGLMLENGVKSNEYTYVSILGVCSAMNHLKHGLEVHGHVLKDEMDSNPFVSNAIIDLYCKCGSMGYAELVYYASGVTTSFSITSMIVGYSSQGNIMSARKYFDLLLEKNSIVWTALFSGYAKQQQPEAVFELLREYRAKESLIPDALIFVAVLGACAMQAALDSGKQVHSNILRNGIGVDKILGSAMVDMYAKCGNITYAESLFQRLADKDLVLYNIMISAYAHHGQDNEAMELYDEMSESGIGPDAVTFIALLSACRHRGLVEQGEKYFFSMVEGHKISPGLDHYACMVDLYGRANRMEKVGKFIRSMPIELDAIMWGTFVNACKMNRGINMAEEAEKLFPHSRNNGSRYIQLANIYAAEGKWDGVGLIRKTMREESSRKHAGCSWLFVENQIHTFISGGTMHPNVEVIYSLLSCLIQELTDDAITLKVEI